jgi:hypothetical protein
MFPTRPTTWRRCTRPTSAPVFSTPQVLNARSLYALCGLQREGCLSMRLSVLLCSWQPDKFVPIRPKHKLHPGRQSSHRRRTAPLVCTFVCLLTPLVCAASRVLRRRTKHQSILLSLLLEQGSDGNSNGLHVQRLRIMFVGNEMTLMQVIYYKCTIKKQARVALVVGKVQQLCLRPFL